MASITQPNSTSYVTGRLVRYCAFNDWMSSTSHVILVPIKVGVSGFNYYGWAGVYHHHPVIFEYLLNVTRQQASFVRAFILPPIPSYVLQPLPLGVGSLFERVQNVFLYEGAWRLVLQMSSLQPQPRSSIYSKMYNRASQGDENLFLAIV
ncbi:hypothetical protein CCACVL1_29202 [Corchorus capsularis]|uniref:Uncharacterized protein n=1 Tax=Corchorus capsularis TaxID=210143 RepID=A0A1R3G371_COCAP|nr:hypothetical protein CCACVL1_29202 [Corchorus capsularis]